MKYMVYHDVPPCARCGSARTAYAVPQAGRAEDIVYSHLKKGEYVFVSDAGTESGYNCICLDCGQMWNQTVPGKIIQKAELDQIKKRKQIPCDVEKMIDTRKTIEKQQEKEQQKKGPKRNKIKKKVGYIIKTILGI